MVAFFAVIAGEIGTTVYMPFSLDQGVLRIKSKLVGGVFYGSAYGFP
jgi:hypothetical protein